MLPLRRHVHNSVHKKRWGITTYSCGRFKAIIWMQCRSHATSLVDLMCEITMSSIMDAMPLTKLKTWKGLLIWFFLLHFPLLPIDMSTCSLHCTYSQKKEECKYQKENMKSYMWYTIVLCGYICTKMVESDHTWKSLEGLQISDTKLGEWSSLTESPMNYWWQGR